MSIMGKRLNGQDLDTFEAVLPIPPERKVMKSSKSNCACGIRIGKGQLACLLILLLVCSSVASKHPRARVRKPDAPTKCGGRCSTSCERLCGTPQFSRCCIGLFTKRSIDEGKVTDNYGYSFDLAAPKPPLDAATTNLHA